MRAYRVAYDGRPFYGFQRQPDVRTVEDELLSALSDLDVPFDGDVPPDYAAAGRTDAGVSAVAQTVAFEAPDWLGPAAFSANLPESIHVWASALAPAGFHATHDARYREYTYFLHAPAPSPDRIRAVESRLSGRKDVHNLTPDDFGTVRTLDLSIEQSGEFLVLTVSAGGFPRQFIRRLASLVEEVLTEQSSLSRIEEVLGPEPLDGAAGISPASPYPLVLTDVAYDIDFQRDETAVSDARTAFEERRIRHRQISDVADTIGRRL